MVNGTQQDKERTELKDENLEAKERAKILYKFKCEVTNIYTGPLFEMEITFFSRGVG